MFEQTCDNCLHFDGCLSEFQQEQPNWCENWESVSRDSFFVEQIVQEISGHRIISVSDLVRWCLENSCFVVLRRNFKFFEELLCEEKSLPSMTHGCDKN